MEYPSGPEAVEVFSAPIILLISVSEQGALRDSICWLVRVGSVISLSQCKEDCLGDIEE